MKAAAAWFWNFLIAIDQLANVILAPVQNGLVWLELKSRGLSYDDMARFGYPDETLSSVYGKNKHDSYYCRAFAWALDKIDRGHTDGAIETDEGN